MNEAAKRLKKEFENPNFRNRLKEQQGNICVNCGSENSIQYHHIVPLSLGGTNNITNIVPLCYKCHRLAHGARNLNNICKPKITGRPKAAPVKNYTSILDRYIRCEIGNKRCKQLLGLPAGCHISEYWYVKEYYKKQEIVSVRNQVDLLKTEKNKINKETSDRTRGIITYKDKRVRIRGNGSYVIEKCESEDE